MKLTEMQSLADEILTYFIQTMPGAPFDTEDIEIVFASNKEFVDRFRAFCGRYAPERLRTLNDGHFEQLNNHVFGNAIIGRTKSAAILRANYRIDSDTLRRIVFHELMHVYCGKTEMDGEHFIDVYGCGHTPDSDPEDRVYDGQVSAGYTVWSEFIAEYYAVMKTMPRKHWFPDIGEQIFSLLAEVRLDNEGAKNAFSMMSAYALTCADADKLLTQISGLSDGSPSGMRAMNALHGCLVLLYEHVQGENPCKITEDFIHELGSKYLMYVLMNSVYLEAN